jgi:hypothetical protein
MLRITTSVFGEGAPKYFGAALATSKYYGSERGQWGSKGAELLELRGDVSTGDVPESLPPMPSHVFCSPMFSLALPCAPCPK